MKNEKSMSIGERASYFYIKHIKKWMFCPVCKDGKMRFSKKLSQWCCDCGYNFTEQYFLDDCVFWFCDECETYLNNQEGFNPKALKHICTNCGYENDTTENNIKGVCSDCSKLLTNPDATLCGACRQARREKARQWLITAGKVVATVAVVAGVVALAASATGDEKETDYTLIPDENDKGEILMKFSYVTDSWMQTASEDELRSVEDEMRVALNNMDYDSDEYLQLDLKRIDVVNTIASRFPLNLPHREHGWYLPNDDD